MGFKSLETDKKILSNNVRKMSRQQRVSIAFVVGVSSLFGAINAPLEGEDKAEAALNVAGLLALSTIGAVSVGGTRSSTAKQLLKIQTREELHRSTPATILRLKDAVASSRTMMSTRAVVGAGTFGAGVFTGVATEMALHTPDVPSGAAVGAAGLAFLMGSGAILGNEYEIANVKDGINAL